jgi:hypothetical protein
MYHLPLVTSSWWAIRWGAWLRKEKKKRIYFGYFMESTWWQRFNAIIWLNTKNVIAEPSLTQPLTFPISKNTLFLFREVVTNADLFQGLREHRRFIKDEILQLLKPDLKIKLNQYSIPVISVHIRRGDFKIANPITPLSFFIHAVRQIRNAVNEEWPVTIFTDAEMHEVADILNEPNVTIATPKPDILDILLMSKSKVIVLSQSSTFSYWGAFLSEAIVLKPYNDWQDHLRNETDNSVWPEIRWKENDVICQVTLREAIKKMYLCNFNT